jgi:Tol biopolymer transport system component
MSSKRANRNAVDPIRGRLILAAVSLATFVLSTGAAPGVAAGEALPSGQIATVVGGGLVVIDATNGARDELTTGVMSEPSWSPDGRELAYVAGDDYGGGASLRAMQAGSGRQQTIAPLGAALSVGPSWSPRGNQLALVTSFAPSPAAAPAEGATLLVIGRNGDRQAVARHLSPFQVPQWAPIGRRLAYLADSGDRLAIWIAKANGSAWRLLRLGLLDSSDTSPSWSPDGQQLAYLNTSAQQDGGAALMVATVDADGTHSRAPASLAGTSDATSAGNLEWSPDGDQLALIRWLRDTSTGRASSALCVADLRRRQITAVVRAPHMQQLAWSHDGSWLAYLTEDPGPSSPRYRIWLVRPDGSGRHALAGFSERTEGLTWRPAQTSRR